MPSEKIENSAILLKKLTNMNANIPNNSQADLVKRRDNRTLKDLTCSDWVYVLILFFVNLINYMDRFTLAGILDDIQKYYDIGDDYGGLLQTAFVISYMIFAPIFGYLGDRYSRKAIMAFGVFLWSITTLAGSFMSNFWWFLFFRSAVGIGEASYSTIAPTIISDLFASSIRSKMLALFYFAIPVGSGLGYIIGSESAKIMGSWQWGLRVTPILGVIATLLLIFILTDPERGESECSGHLEVTPWKDDMKDLCKNKSFMFSTFGATCVAFVAGALSWWGPKFVLQGIQLQKNGSETDIDTVSFRFGIVAMLAGVTGVLTGSMLAQRLRDRFPTVDAHICGIGLLVSAPLVFLSCVTAQYNAALCYTLIFFAEFFLNLTWALVADILLFDSRVRRNNHGRRRGGGYVGLLPERKAQGQVAQSGPLHLWDGVNNILPITDRLSSTICGITGISSGVVGIIIGASLSLWLRPRWPNVDPLINSVAILISVAFIFSFIFFQLYVHEASVHVLFFLANTFMNIITSIANDVEMYVVIPTRRSTGEGFQLMISHALGDAGSPYLIGVLSELLQKTLSGTASEPMVKFRALQYSLFTTCFVEVLGGLLFLFCAFYVVEDKKRCDATIQEGQQSEANDDEEERVPVPVPEEHDLTPI